MQASLDYGQYYLYLKSLSAKDFKLEIQRQKKSLKTNDEGAQMRIVLLYALPQSPIHNAYTAKTVLNKELNKQLDKQLSETKFPQTSTSNSAFVSLLKDQLNQQIKLIEHLKQSHSNDEEELILSLQITELKEKVMELSEQIEQLREIDKNISSQGLY